MTLPLPYSASTTFSATERSELLDSLYRPNRNTVIGSYVPSYMLPTAALMAATAYRLQPYNLNRAKLYAIASALTLLVPLWSVTAMYTTNRDLKTSLEDLEEGK